MGGSTARRAAVRDRSNPFPPVDHDRSGVVQRIPSYSTCLFSFLAAAGLVSMAGYCGGADSYRAALVRRLQLGQFLHPKQVARTITGAVPLAKAGAAHSQGTRLAQAGR